MSETLLTAIATRPASATPRSPSTVEGNRKLEENSPTTETPRPNPGDELEARVDESQEWARTKVTRLRPDGFCGESDEVVGFWEYAEEGKNWRWPPAAGLLGKRGDDAP